MSKTGIKILLSALLFTKAAYVNISYSANSLDVEFNGELISTMCVVASDSINKEVKLSNIRWQTINEDGKSDITPFSISIDKCSAADLQKTIKLTLQSNQLVTISGNSFLSTTGNSKVVLGIVDKNGLPVVWNKAVSVGQVTVADGLQNIDFGVYVKKPERENANPGDFSGVLSFTMEYE